MATKIWAKDEAGSYQVYCYGKAEPGMNFYGIYEGADGVEEEAIFEGPEEDSFTWTDVVREIADWCHEQGARIFEISAV